MTHEMTDKIVNCRSRSNTTDTNSANLQISFGDLRKIPK